jgi:hypothetical protein
VGSPWPGELREVVNMRRIVVLLSLLVPLLGVMARPAAAQVPPHEHLMTVPGTGTVEQVGPPRCEIGATLQTAFLNFHFNVHLGQPTATGVLSITPSFCP